MIRFFLLTLLLLSVSVQAANECRSIPHFVPDAIQEAARAAVMIQVAHEYSGSVTIGSGFFINKEGRIATNFHVIEESYYEEQMTGKRVQYRVITNIHGCRAFFARPVFTQNDGPMIPDIAFLDIVDPPEDLPVARFAEEVPAQGAEVYAIGSPHGRTNTITKGYVLGMYHKDDVYHDYIHATASIQEGNSGSMLVNARGRVVGMVQACGGSDVGNGRTVCMRNTYAIPTQMIIPWMTFIE